MTTSAADPLTPTAHTAPQALESIEQPRRFVLHGVEIRPDATKEELGRLAAKLGRPRAHAEAEDLVRKWSDFIQHLREQNTQFEKILGVLLAGPDQEIFRREFTDDGEINAKSLRKFRTLVGTVLAPDKASPKSTMHAS